VVLRWQLLLFPRWCYDRPCVVCSTLPLQTHHHHHGRIQLPTNISSIWIRFINKSKTRSNFDVVTNLVDRPQPVRNWVIKQLLRLNWLYERGWIHQTSAYAITLTPMMIGQTQIFSKLENSVNESVGQFALLCELSRQSKQAFIQRPAPES